MYYHMHKHIRRRILFMKSKIFITITILFLILNMSHLQNCPGNDEWKNLWYVNTIWYQIFPDRFYNRVQQNDPVYSEKYDNKGKLLLLKLVSWEEGIPTTTNKFGGDLAGITEKLEYLEDLGITGIWLNPIFASTSNHRYNTSDYRKIDFSLGTEEDLKILLDKAHNKGIKIILDGVFNHTGYEFWAFQDIVEHGSDSKYKDWYFIKSFPVKKLWTQNKKNPPNYTCWWGIGSLPKLNMENPQVREHIYQITRKWMALGIDGWRLDVPNEIDSEEFWISWCRLVKSIKQDAYISGEIWEEGAKWVNSGEKFDGLMNYYAFRDPVLQYFAAQSLTVSQFDRILEQRRNLYPHRVNCAMQNLLGSHDTARFLSSLYNKDRKDSDKEKKQYYKGPVDGETIKRFKIAVLFQMTYVGCPMIYYGDEIGMVGGKDPDCRRPMIWNQEKQNRELHKWHKDLIKIRKNHRALRTGEFKTILTDDKNDIFAFLRHDNTESLIIVFNYSSSPHPANLPVGNARSFSNLLDGTELKSGENNILTLNLEPFSGMILLEE